MTLACLLEDVEDVQAFADWRVRMALGQNGHLTDDQRQQACEEAVVLIYELHGRWDRGRCARFSAFLLSYLDRALIDWWRRELRQSGRGSWNGASASYRYHGMTSLDARAPEDEQIQARALTSHDPHG